MAGPRDTAGFRPSARASRRPSARRRAVGRFVGGALALLALGAADAAAFDLKLWPLLDLSVEERRTHLSLLGPIFEWERTSDETEWGVRPLFRVRHDHRREKTEGTSLYPVAWWEKSDRSLFFRLFGLLTYETLTEESSAVLPYARRFDIYPFVFYRKTHEGERFLSVLPIYANLENFAGYSRLRMVLFPLYFELEEPLYTRRWIGFPLFSWVGGPEGSGFRIWPLWGRTTVGDHEDTVFTAWPFYVRHTEFPEHEGRKETRIYWPFFSIHEGPHLESRTYGYLLVFPLLTHTTDTKANTETYGFPWPLWSLHRRLDTREVLSIRLIPFYQDRRTEIMRSRFWLWPVYRYREGIGDYYERRDVFFILYRDQREGEGRRRRRYNTLLPLWFHRREPEWVRTQVPTLFEGLFPKNDKLHDVWAPLWRLYAREESAGVVRHDVLWKMWEWGSDGTFRPPWYISWGTEEQ